MNYSTDLADRVTMKDTVEIEGKGGMIPARRVYEHEILLSFYDDDGSYAFEEWFVSVGREQFRQWLTERSNNDT